MGTVIDLAAWKRNRNHTSQKYLYRKSRRHPWKVKDIPKGQKPRGHPKITFGPRGRVLIARRQVWVEGHTGALWVIYELFKNENAWRGSLYPYVVGFKPYRSKDARRSRLLAETTFRSQFAVWEIHKRDHAVLMEKLNRSSECDPSSPFRGKGGAAQAREFFGLDEDGNRIDD